MGEDPIVFFTTGIAMTKGSWKPILNPKTKRIFLIPDSKKLRPWEAAIKASARSAHSGKLLSGAVSIEVVFFMPRSKSSWKKDGSLVSGAPTFPIVKDVDKLLRAVMDSLTGVIWEDDKQVMHASATKQYIGKPTDPHGAWIKVESYG